jgi:hypothetical protein
MMSLSLTQGWTADALNIGSLFCTLAFVPIRHVPRSITLWHHSGASPSRSHKTNKLRYCTLISMHVCALTYSCCIINSHRPIFGVCYSQCSQPFVMQLIRCRACTLLATCISRYGPTVDNRRCVFIWPSVGHVYSQYEISNIPIIPNTDHSS